MKFSINCVKNAIPPKLQHYHKNYEINAYISGEGVFCSGEKEIKILPGMFIIVPPETMHISKVSGENERFYINGEFNPIFNLCSPTVIYDNPEKEGEFLVKMIYKNRLQNPEYISSLCNTLAHFLIQNFKMDNEISLKVKEIADEITARFFDYNIDLNAILNKSGYAEDYIRAQFKKITGKTPTEFLTSVRVSHACHLIDIYKDVFTLSEIAEKCGYTDYVYFSRRFKGIMGMSPREYMKH